MREILPHEEQDSIFRTLDRRHLHAATDGEMFVITCGEEYTYVVVNPIDELWEVWYVEHNFFEGPAYLGQYPRWVDAKACAERVVQWKGLREESLVGSWYSKMPTRISTRGVT